MAKKYKRLTKVIEKDGKKTYLCNLLKQELIEALGRAEDILAPYTPPPVPKFKNGAVVYAVDYFKIPQTSDFCYSVRRLKVRRNYIGKDYIRYYFNGTSDTYKEENLYSSDKNARRAAKRLNERQIVTAHNLPKVVGSYILFMTGRSLFPDEAEESFIRTQFNIDPGASKVYFYRNIYTGKIFPVACVEDTALDQLYILKDGILNQVTEPELSTILESALRGRRV